MKAQALRRRYGRARLTSRQRARLPASAFALESRRELPILDAGHVRAAFGRLENMRDAGHLTASEYDHAHARIEAAARRFP